MLDAGTAVLDASLAVGAAAAGATDVEPPKSLTSLPNAVARLDSAVDKEFDAPPAAEVVPPP